MLQVTLGFFWESFQVLVLHPQLFGILYNPLQHYGGGVAGSQELFPQDWYHCLEILRAKVLGKYQVVGDPSVQKIGN